MSKVTNQLYWLLAVPNEKSHESTILRLGNCVSEFAECTPFNVPELKVGTLDSLLIMSEELAKIDHMIDHTTRKIGNQIYTLRDSKPEKGSTWLTIGQGTN
jgi:V-type H+-transporting ATPase subunit C